jgi:miniconductance mechanosensitive channel
MSELEAWLKTPYVAQALGLGILFSASLILYLVSRWGVAVGLRRLAGRSSTQWDDEIVRHGVFVRLAHFPPALLVVWGIGLVPDLDSMLATLLQRAAVSVLVVTAALAAGAFLTAANEIYELDPERRKHPIKGYLQVVKIILYLVAGLLVVATLLDRSPWIFLSGIGAAAAVLLLVFRDTILGLVASIQLTGNDMVQVGDWIEMPQYGADGDVIDVALHTVKVQNWDKTITTIPTHKLIEDSFKNWRGMSASGGRRIKRAISFDTDSIGFLEEDEIDRLGKFALLRDYIEEKRRELAEFNAQQGRDSHINADIRRLTNIGTLRAYMLRYLRNHDKIHQGMTLLVRQLAPTAEGLPIEVYAFSNDTSWDAFESIQADIFDHFLAIAPEFGLRAFQSPTGADMRAIGGVR